MSKKTKPFPCDGCDKGFDTELALWQHCLMKHPQKNMKKPKYVPPELSTEKSSEAIAAEEKS